jgi:pimeloyl-ACP methyl ester carboxylesterase
MGYERVDLVSESAGTRFAQAYAIEHPDSIHRSVMVAVNPPGHFLWDGRDSDAQIRRYAALCRRDPECAERTPDLAASMRGVARDTPERWGFLPIHRGNVRIASFFGLMENGEKASPLNAASTFDSFLSAEEGDAAGLWAQSFMPNLMFPETQVWGDVAAIARADRSASRRTFAAGDPGTTLGNAATSFLFGDGGLIDAWPANQDDDAYADPPAVDTETLLVTGEFDGATPASNQADVLPGLRNGRSVVLEGLGHTIDFWDMQPAASTRLITTFLEQGRVDRSGYRPHKVQLAPEKPMGDVARMLFGVLIGLPVLVALVLAGIAWRVRRRGRLATWSSAVVRTAFAVVAALAGWMAMVIAVLAGSIAVPLDEPALVLAVMAVPAAAAVHAGWADRSRSPRTRRTGMAAAFAGAVIGGWLGYHAGADFLALATTAVGAVAAANLALVAFDVWATGAGTPPMAPVPPQRRGRNRTPAEEVAAMA